MFLWINLSTVEEKQYYLLILFYISSFFMTQQIQSTEQSVFLNSKISPCFKFKTLQQTPLVLNSKNIASATYHESNSLMDN